MNEFNSVNSSPETLKKNTRGKVLTIIIIAVLAILIAAVGYLGWNWFQMRKQFAKLTMPQGIQELQKKATDETIAKVKKHILLPEGEDPIVATVTDADALKKQSDFYAAAKNNDIVIIYTKAKKAFLYDPDRDIILNVGPVIDQSTPSPTPSESATPSASATKSPKAS